MSIGGLASRIAGVAVVALALSASSAGAATVLNPGPVVASFNSGSMNIGGILQVPFSTASPVVASGAIDEDGTLTMPGENVVFPPLVATVPLPAPNTPFTMQIVATGVSGNLDPSTGKASVVVNVRVDVTIANDTTCTIGTNEAPVRITLTTNRPGQPYDPDDGSIVLFSRDWPVPGFTNCTGPLAARLGILQVPVLSPAGSSTLTLRGTINREGTLALLQGERQCVVPPLKGKTLATARRALKTANCSAGDVKRRTSSKKRGTVLGSTPKAKTTHPAGTEVDLLVSKGPAKKRR